MRDVLKEKSKARLGVHETEIKHLEAKVKQLREQLALRCKKQEEIVDFRLQQILREAQGLGWGAEAVTDPRAKAEPALAQPSLPPPVAPPAAGGSTVTKPPAADPSPKLMGGCDRGKPECTRSMSVSAGRTND